MRHHLRRMVQWSLIALLILIAGIITPILWEAYRLPARAQASARLAALYADDQAARYAGFADVRSLLGLLIGDWQRLQQVRRIMDAHMLSRAEDYYHAAMILQHGQRPDDFLRAQAAAQRAAELGDARGIGLSALAEDRYLISLDQPQRYGSQFFCSSPEGWQLYPVDQAVTDQERQALGMPSLDEQLERLRQIQERTNGQCALSPDLMRELESLMN